MGAQEPDSGTRAGAQTRLPEGQVTEQTDQGEQAVIPGAEKISDKELAERQMEGRKKSDARQKEPDEELFDVSGRRQDKLFSNRLIGRLLDVAPKNRQKREIASELRGKEERKIIKDLIRDLVRRNNLRSSSVQAALWYFEQRLYRNHGINSDSTNFSGAARVAVEKRESIRASGGRGPGPSGQAPSGVVGTEGSYSDASTLFYSTKKGRQYPTLNQATVDSIKSLAEQIAPQANLEVVEQMFGDESV